MDVGRLSGCGFIAFAVLGGAGGCHEEDKIVCTTIGRAGGVLQSYDSVLTIAIQPEALDDARAFCIAKTAVPPEVFGDTYIVGPPTRLTYDAVISFRGTLPDDLSDVNIGRISGPQFAAGYGTWTSLSGCRVDEDVRHVQCVDDQLSKFYGLLDQRLVLENPDGETTSGESSGSSTGMPPDTTDTDDPGTATGTDTGTETGTDTDPTPTPIDYPPECDDLFRGPYTVVEAGQRFDPEDAEGSEDLAADGHGGFVGRHGPAFARLDVSGGTLGTPDDPGFGIREVFNTPLLWVPTLGLRYAPSGDMLFTSYDEDRIRAMRPNGTTYVAIDDLETPNGLHIDIDGAAWYSESTAGRVQLYDLEAKDGYAQTIALLEEASGVYHDTVRRVLFYASADDGQVNRVSTADSTMIGEPAIVAELGGEVHGLAMDICGNLYAVDSGPSDRLLRLFMNDIGAVTELEVIATDIHGQPSSATFGVGEAYGAFSTALFMLGPTGELTYVDMQIGGAVNPVRDSPAPTVHVANGSFEQEPLLPGVFDFSDEPPVRWEVWDPGVVIDGNNHSVGLINAQDSPLYTSGAPEGDHAALVFLWSDPVQPAGLSQRLHTRLAANTDYTLHVQVGNPADPPGAPFSLAGFPGYRIELLAGDTVLVADDNTLLPAEGEFLESTIVYSSTGNEAEIGERLEVRLILADVTAGLEVGFDDVKLEVVPR